LHRQISINTAGNEKNMTELPKEILRWQDHKHLEHRVSFGAMFGRGNSPQTFPLASDAALAFAH